MNRFINSIKIYRCRIPSLSLRGESPTLRFNRQYQKPWSIRAHQFCDPPNYVAKLDEPVVKGAGTIFEKRGDSVCEEEVQGANLYILTC